LSVGSKNLLGYVSWFFLAVWDGWMAVLVRILTAIDVTSLKMHSWHADLYTGLNSHWNTERDS